MSKIALVGPMGAGKSTIGRLLAGILRAPFYDSDHVIEEKTGADIPWIFDVEGEEGFRDRETAALVSLLEIDALVLATGGGIVLREKNRQLLKYADAVIYLKADTERLVQRTMRDKNRPLLQVDDPRKKIVELLEERDPLYREVATHVILTDSRSPKMIAQQVAARLTAEP